MSEFISFDTETASIIDVDINITASLKEILGLLNLIQLGYDMGLGDEEVDFLNLYEIVFQQIVSYGYNISEDNDE